MSLIKLSDAALVPPTIGNFSIPWVVDGTARILLTPGLPIIPLQYVDFSTLRRQYFDLQLSAETMNTPSKEDLDNLFGPMYEEYLKKKLSDTPINSAEQPTQIHEDSPSTSSIIVDEHEAPPIMTTSNEQTSPISLTEADDFNQEDSVNFDGNSQFISYNPPSHEEIESSTTALEP
ncbi:hypothetical protein Tco_1249572 [Tanacetum coccineum]